MQEEIWKDVVGYEGVYQVSNLGRVKSLDRVIRCVSRLGKEYYIQKDGAMLKASKDASGYEGVVLAYNGKLNSFKVHRLVAQAFVPNPDNLPCVDHINTIPSDNRVENLRWVTLEENANNNIISVQKRFANKASFSHRRGLNKLTKTIDNRFHGIGVGDFSVKPFLGKRFKEGAFLAITLKNGRKVCDFGVSLENLQALRDEISEYLDDAKNISC